MLGDLVQCDGNILPLVITYRLLRPLAVRRVVRNAPVR